MIVSERGVRGWYASRPRLAGDPAGHSRRDRITDDAQRHLLLVAVAINRLISHVAAAAEHIRPRLILGRLTGRISFTVGAVSPFPKHIRFNQDRLLG